MAERKLRCAVYTRKSTEDGLEQEFNSLDAQYEACSAYALSQRHEGWTLLPDRYDDGGFSGGNMQRPGLVRLLADVAAGRIDIILIYKIDRLTRSLTDFARIVDVFDKAGASFVSVTQSFNTTTSMGRLTLNMLLSFAQFEREVTGERIRDKIAASKRKGMWMGGTVPLGYDVRDRRLVVNETEAELVRHIMRRYLTLDSVQEVAAELNRDGYRTKVQRGASGPHRGGCSFQRGTLYHLLSNRIYLGDIVHKSVAHRGEHEAIVPKPLWDEVQAAIKERGSGGARRRAINPSLLAGLLFDGEERPMTPSHATKGKRRYRYYITRPDLLDHGPAWRVSAHDLEAIVCARIAGLLTDMGALHALSQAAGGDGQLLQAIMAAGDLMAATLRSGTSHERIMRIEAIAPKVMLDTESILIAIDPTRLLIALGQSVDAVEHDPIILICDTVRVRRGHELRLVMPSPKAPPPPAQRNEKLVALIAEASTARKLLLDQPDRPLARIAAEAGRCRSRLARLAALGCLAPDIVTAIVEGRQPTSLDHRALMAIDLPLGWDEQRALLGVG